MFLFMIISVLKHFLSYFFYLVNFKEIKKKRMELEGEFLLLKILGRIE